MSNYIDGFVLPVPKANLETYRAMAGKAAKVWREYGALEYRECVLEDPTADKVLSFPQLAAAKDDETVVFAYITYTSREHRDEVNAKVMADPRMQEMCGQDGMPFDFTRMAYGGFSVIVEA